MTQPDYYYDIVPMFNQDGSEIIGISIMIVNGGGYWYTGADREFTMINPLDQRFSKYLHKYKDEYMRFGILTLYNQQKMDPEYYYIIASANVLEE